MKNSNSASVMQSVGLALAGCGVILAAGFAFASALPAAPDPVREDWERFKRYHELCVSESTFGTGHHCPNVAARLAAARVRP